MWQMVLSGLGRDRWLLKYNYWKMQFDFKTKAVAAAVLFYAFASVQIPTATAQTVQTVGCAAPQSVTHPNYRIDNLSTTPEISIPRIPKQPVKSLLDHLESEPLDTLETGNDYVKVVIFSDNTWRYIKTDDFLALQADVFDKNWSTTGTDPYHLDWKDFPTSWSIWLVDSLNQYHVPYQGKVNPRGKFGPRRGRRHQGVDLPLSTGAPIYAAFPGKVRVSTSMRGYGNLVVIRHENGLETFYGHLSRRDVQSGDFVNAGDVIGLGGSTGRSTGPHLHFETRYMGYAFDPQWLIDFETGELRRRMFVLKKKYLNQYSNYEQNFDDEFKTAEEDAAEEAALAAMRWHTVRSGDTLGKIAINNHTTVSAICRLNGIKSTTTLRIGQKLRVR